MKRKTFITGEVKAIGDDGGPGEFEVILSAPTLDRDGEVVDPGIFEPLPSRIPFDIDHGLSTATTVGSGVPFYDGDMLKVRGTFASTPLGQEVRTLVTEGHIAATSVAMAGVRRVMKDGVPHIVAAELLNGTFTPIPSNREAVVLAAKSAAADAKALPGSYEARTDQLRDAIREANPDAWGYWIVATFDGEVVYELDGMDGVERYQAAYEISPDGLVTMNDPKAVEIVEVVLPVDDATAPSNDTPEDAAAADKAAAATPPVLSASARTKAAAAAAALLDL